MAEKTSDNINRQARDFYNKALQALDRNNIDYAIEMFNQCLAAEPNFVKARQYLRATQMKRAESSGGLKRMFATAKTAPLLTKAKMAAQKNAAEAMVMAEQVLNEDPKNGQALLILAEAAEAAGYPETTAQALEHYTKLNPRDTKAMHWLARTYGQIERHDLALEEYEQLLTINPNDFEAQKGLKDSTAHGAMAGGGWQEASSYRDVLKNESESVALEQASKFERAEDVIENLIQENLAKLAKDPDNPVIKRELGKLYAQKNDFDTALRYLEAIYAAEAGADPALEREIAEIKVKRAEFAIAEKKKMLAAHPANAATLQAEITKLETQLDQIRLADAERLVERYPNDLLYRYELGLLYMRTGNNSGAIEQFQKSATQPQRRIASLNNLGLCFMKEGLYDLAVDAYATAIKEQPAMDGLKKELIYNLGAAYEAMGDMEKAVAEYKKIAAVDFGYRDVKEKIMRKKPPTPAR